MRFQVHRDQVGQGWLQILVACRFLLAPVKKLGFGGNAHSLSTAEFGFVDNPNQ